MILTVEKTMTRLSNAGEADRTYTVSGTVYKKSGGTFEAVREGQVNSRENANLAWFSCGITEPLSINFTTADITPAEQSAVVADIQEFIAAAKES